MSAHEGQEGPNGKGAAYMHGGTAEIGRAAESITAASVIAFALICYLTLHVLSLAWIAYYILIAMVVRAITRNRTGAYLARFSAAAWILLYTLIFVGVCVCYSGYYVELKNTLTGTNFMYGQHGDEYYYYQLAGSSLGPSVDREYLGGLDALYGGFHALSKLLFELTGHLGSVPINILAVYATGFCIGGYVAKGAGDGIGRQCTLLWACNPEVHLWATSFYKETLIAFAVAGLLYATTIRQTALKGAAIAAFGAFAVVLRASAGFVTIAICVLSGGRRLTLGVLLAVLFGVVLFAWGEEVSALAKLFFSEQRLGVLLGGRIASVTDADESLVLYAFLLLVAIAGVAAEFVQPMLHSVTDGEVFSIVNAYLAAPALYWLVLFPYFVAGFTHSGPLGRRAAITYVALAALVAGSLLIFTGRHRFMLVPLATISVGLGLAKGVRPATKAAYQLLLVIAWAAIAMVR